MALILDSSGLLAAVNTDQHFHRVAREALEPASAPRLISPFALAELDYMIPTYHGRDEELDLLAEVESGACRSNRSRLSAYRQAKAITEQYTSFEDVGLADASNAVLARRHNTRDILTLDERHLLLLRRPHNPPLRLLPADS